MQNIIKVIISLSFCFLLLTVICGCNKRDVKNFFPEESVNMIVDSNERDLLCEIYSNNFEVEALESGNPFEYQKETLNQIRMLKEYLYKKYPSHSFEIAKIIPKAFSNDPTRFAFKADKLELLFSAELSNKGIFEDDFYVFLIGSTFDDELKKLLVAEDAQVCIVNTSFNSRIGSELGGDFSFKKIVELGKSLPHDTAIYISESYTEKEAEKVEGSIFRIMRSGSYRVYYSADFATCSTVEECKRLWESNDVGIYCHVFHIN